MKQTSQRERGDAQQGQEPLMDQNAAGPIFLHMGDKGQGIKTPSPGTTQPPKQVLGFFSPTCLKWSYNLIVR